MSEEEIINLAEEISFKLLATKKHTDFDWLVKKLKTKIKNKKKMKKINLYWIGGLILYLIQI